ncbi:MAG: pyridoxamine 5'-phosphate oxidase family protein [Erysipelotrichaceae bacterium]|nr:pyridoxamine 5'-phosphate oxidase family protein [Erysipelotrichaceae bacterium]
MNEVYDYLKKCGTYYLATVENDQPRVRPFGTVCLFENKLYIQTGKSKDVAKQIANSPKVEICACTGPTWIRVAGTLVEDERIEAQEAMLNDYPSLKNTYQAGDGNTVVYYFKEATATLSSFNDEPKVYHF